MGACVHACESLCVCMFVGAHACVCVAFLTHSAPLLSCSLPPTTGSRPWLSVPPQLLFLCRETRWVGNAEQECQALFQKPGFCFISLLNRSCFLFPCLGHQPAPSPVLALPAASHRVPVDGNGDTGLKVFWLLGTCLCLVRL